MGVGSNPVVSVCGIGFMAETFICGRVQSQKCRVRFPDSAINLFQMSGGCKIQDRSVEVEAVNYVKNARAEVRCRRTGGTDDS